MLLECGMRSYHWATKALLKAPSHRLNHNTRAAWSRVKFHTEGMFLFFFMWQSIQTV